jgi:hypothetical protein
VLRKFLVSAFAQFGGKLIAGDYRHFGLGAEVFEYE